MKKKVKEIVHFWDKENPVDEGSPCGDRDPEAVVSYREQDVTCQLCLFELTKHLPAPPIKVWH